MRPWGSERSTSEQNTGRSDTGYWAVTYYMNSPGGVSELTGTLVTQDQVRCCLIVKSATDAATKTAVLFCSKCSVFFIKTLKLKDPFSVFICGVRCAVCTLMTKTMKINLS